MNKAERHRQKLIHFKRRVATYGVSSHSLRTTGKPCSCAMCSPGKELCNGEKKREYKELQFELCA